MSLPLPSFSLMRPSCGRRRSAISSRDMILQTAHNGVFQLQGRLHDLVQGAVYAKPHPEHFFVRLNVNVAGLLLNRLSRERS